jgi:hypothetical protein
LFLLFFIILFSLAWTFPTSASLLSQQASCLIQSSSPLPPPPPPVVHHKTSITRHRTTTHLETKQKKISTTTTINSNTSNNTTKQQSLVPVFDQPQKQSLSPKKEALTFHLHTHHHHHIHNPNPAISSNASSLLKSPNPTKTTTVPLSPQKSCVSVNKEQLVETKTLLPLSVNNVVKKEHQQISINELSSSPIRENEALNFSIKYLSANKKPTLTEYDETIRKTTTTATTTNPKKTSPAKGRVNSESKSNG